MVGLGKFLNVVVVPTMLWFSTMGDGRFAVNGWMDELLTMVWV